MRSPDTTSRSAIERLIFLYAERIDAGDFAGVADLFSDAVIKVSGSVVAADRAAVQRMYETHTRRYDDGTPHTKHVVTNVVVEVDEQSGTAAARAYFTVFQALFDFPLQPIIAGRYLDRFAQMGGEWRFTERDIIPELYGDLSRHLLKGVPET
jgi:3-phenylpropionate/cinnamic acid dioxygenase small subunit